MQPKSYSENHYRSAFSRTFESTLNRFLKKTIPQLGGPELRKTFITKLIELFEENIISIDRIQPGQMLWIAVDKNTRADSKKVKYKPIILTLVDQNDIEDLVDGNSNGNPSRQFGDVIARICKEAYEQNALMSMRDIGLIFKRHSSSVSYARKKFEDNSGVILPTPATLQDMGSGVTHKKMILEKILIDKKEMSQVRTETFHSQRAIDNYVKDYRRVEILLDDNKSIEYISKVTNIRPFVIKQYAEIYENANNY